MREFFRANLLLIVEETAVIRPRRSDGPLGRVASDRRGLGSVAGIGAIRCHDDTGRRRHLQCGDNLAGARPGLEQQQDQMSPNIGIFVAPSKGP
jgi:hypothetical protein